MEKDEVIDSEKIKKKDLKKFISGKTQTSVLISREFYDLSKTYNIQFSEAMRVGISMLLAERGVVEYDNRLNLYRKMVFFRLELERISREFEEFKTKVNKMESNNAI